MEHWLPIIGYETRYEVSDHGRVRSLEWFAPNKVSRTARKPATMLKLNRFANGRLMVKLYLKDRPARWRQVHHLVLEAFIGPRPVGLEACHGDGNPENNAVNNLRWDTAVENQQDAIRHGRNHALNKTHCKHGHPFDETNTYRPPGNPGRRQCRACTASRQKLRDAIARKCRTVHVSAIEESQ